MRLAVGKGCPFGAPSALSDNIVLFGKNEYLRNKKGAASPQGLPLTRQGCVEGLYRKVLKIDRPAAGGFLSLTSLRAEGCSGGSAAL